MLFGTVEYFDGTRAVFPIKEERQDENTVLLTVGGELPFENIRYLNFDTGLSHATAGEDGYYIVVQAEGAISDCGLCYFRDRPDTEIVSNDLVMPLFGAKTPRGTYAAVVTGMTYECGRVLSVKNGEYRCFPRFRIDGKTPYEPIGIMLSVLPDSATYADIARVYRRYRIEKCGFSTLKERETPGLRYAAESIYVRVRLAWKPVPSPVPEQTPENEPPMHVAATFRDVEKIMDDYRAAGVGKAEFCLVGWNYRGHDGRWPQIFPVEPELGGEEGLRHLLSHAKTLGYTVSCHTSSVDAYRIADCFSIDDIIVREDGSISAAKDGIWGGGRAYDVCPVCGLRQAKELLPGVAAFGFDGLHYIDVITCVPPRACYHPLHPLSRRGGAETWEKIMRYGRDLFGGISSEGAYDAAMRDCDFILYGSYAKNESDFAGVIDKTVPLWQIVYHGLTMSNPYCRAVNCAIDKNPDTLLKVIEYGGRPVLYYYSRFVDESSGRKNWMSDDDYIYEDAATHRPFVEKTKELWDIYEQLSDLQWETIEDHAEIAPRVFRTVYSDNSVVTVDYNTKTWERHKAE